MLATQLTATLTTIKWRTELAPRHPGICRRIVLYHLQAERTSPQRDFKPQNAALQQMSELYPVTTGSSLNSRLVGFISHVQPLIQNSVSLQLEQ